MTKKDNKQVGEILIKLGQALKTNPLLITQLEEFLNLQKGFASDTAIDFEKIGNLDLFQLIRERTEDEVDQILSSFNLKELREILKRYRFGSPSKLKTPSQIKHHILHQLRQRKTDVFHNPQNIHNVTEEKK